MIKLLVTIVVRAFVELSLVLLILSGVFLLVAYRTGRRFVTTTPDGLDKLAGPIAAGLALVARARAGDTITDTELVELDDELGLDDDEPGDEWEDYVV